MSKITSAFEILQNLTKSEKRYISIIVNRTVISTSKKGELDKFEEAPSHIQLFVLLSNLPRIDDGPIEKILERKDYLKLKEDKPGLFTTVNINRLIDFVFSSLRQFNAEKPDYSIINYIQNIRILQEKRLYSQADEWIEKGLKELGENERPNADMYALLLKERRTYNILLQRRTQKEYNELKQISKDSIDLLRRVEVEVRTAEDQQRNQEYDSDDGFPEGFDYKTEYSPTTQSFIENPYVNWDIPLVAMLRACFVAYTYWKRNPEKDPNNAEKAMLCAKAMVERFDGKKQLQKTSRGLYIRVLQTLANVSIYFGYVTHLEKHIDLFKEILNIKPNSPIEQEIGKIKFGKQSLEEHYQALNVLLHYYKGVGALDTAYSFVMHTKDQLEQGTPRNSILLTLYLNCAGICLLKRDHVGALGINRRIKAYTDDNPEVNTASLITFESELLDVIIQLDQDSPNASQNELFSGIGKLIARYGAVEEKLEDLEEEESIVTHKDSLIMLLNRLLGILLEKKKGELKNHYEKIDQIFTNNRGPFVSSVFPLWARAKIRELA